MRSARGGSAPTPVPPPEVSEIPIGVRRSAAWSWRLLLVVACAAVVLRGVSHVMAIVVPVLVAILLAALLGPLVTLLARHTVLGRGAASAIALLGLVLVVVGMSTFVGQQLMLEFTVIQAQAIHGFEQLAHVATTSLHLDQPTLQRAQTELLARLQANSDALIQGAMTGVEKLGTALTGLVICLFTLFFLLKDGEAIWRWCVGLLPEPARLPTHEAFRRGWKALAAYVRTQILVATINGLGIGIGVAALGLGMYAVPIVLIVFLFSFIPLLGAVVSGAIAALLVLVLKGWVMALVMIGIVLLVHFIEADILHPFLMGWAVRLHPLGVFLGVALGAETLGVVGALIAIPLAAFLNATLLQAAGRDPSPELGRDSRTAAFLAARARNPSVQRLRERARRLAATPREASVSLLARTRIRRGGGSTRAGSRRR